MVRPLDMQVAMQAVPEQAGRVHQEQAGAVYRQTQEIGQARSESLQRQERVSESAARSGAQFEQVRQSRDQISPRLNEMESRSARRRDNPDDRGAGLRLYGPQNSPSATRHSDQGAGLVLDLSA